MDPTVIRDATLKYQEALEAYLRSRKTADRALNNVNLKRKAFLGAKDHLHEVEREARTDLVVA